MRDSAFRPIFGGSLPDRYSRIEKVGVGAYGAVYKSIDTCTGETVAVKKIKFDVVTEGIPSTALREITILRTLNHENIVKYLYSFISAFRLHDVVITDRVLYLVFEYVPFHLQTYLHRAEKLGDLTPALKKKLFYQTAKAVEFLHSKRIMHRDLKLQNILVNSSGMVKIADFGLARQYSLPIKAYTHEVVTIWYRAPEILLGSPEYTTAVDTWSLGCMLAEFYNNAPLFTGDCEIDQLFKIFQKLGTPTEEQWNGVTKLRDYMKEFPKWKPQPMSTICEEIGKDGRDLLMKMLAYDPTKRISLKAALNHPFFNGME